MTRSTITVLIAAGLTAAAAQATTITAFDFTQGWGTTDTRAGGTSGITTDQPRNGNGSLRLTTDSSIAGSSAAKANANGVAGTATLGTLGDLAAGTLTMDFFRAAASTVPAYGSVNVKLYVVNSSGQGGNLNWEAVYNGFGGGVAANSWYDDFSIGSGNFWIRSGTPTGHNFDTGSNFQSLASWAGGYTATDGAFTSITLDSATRVIGVELGFGSGVNGYFEGYADDLNISFGNAGPSYSYNFETVPAPAAAGLLGLGALAGLRRRR